MIVEPAASIVTTLPVMDTIPVVPVTEYENVPVLLLLDVGCGNIKVLPETK